MISTRPSRIRWLSAATSCRSAMPKIIAPTTSRVLIEQLKARGFEVAAVDTSEISKTGGGIHCMAQALRREAAEPPGGRVGKNSRSGFPRFT